jgi:hypothetical protein
LESPSGRGVSGTGAVPPQDITELTTSKATSGACRLTATPRAS